MQESTSYQLHQLVFMLDRSADTLLRTQFGISHKRALLLLILQGQQPTTQHQLAVALGHTDPAVSALLVTLIRDGYVLAEQDPHHKRKHVVTLTPKGESLVNEAKQLLDANFAKLLKLAGVDARQYGDMTERLCAVLMSNK